MITYANQDLLYEFYQNFKINNQVYNPNGILKLSPTMKLSNYYYYIKQYILIDFYDWLEMITVKRNDFLTCFEVEELDRIIEVRLKYLNFILLTKTKFTKEDLERKTNRLDNIEKELDKIGIQDLLSVYSIFVSHIENLQLTLLSDFADFSPTIIQTEYSKKKLRYSACSLPIILIPFSFAINRLVNKLVIIKQNNFNTINKEIDIPLKTYLSSQYKENGDIKDKPKKDGIHSFYGESLVIEDLPRYSILNNEVELFHLELPKFYYKTPNNKYILLDDTTTISSWELKTLSDLSEEDKESSIILDMDKMTRKQSSSLKAPTNKYNVQNSIDLLPKEWLEVIISEKGFEKFNQFLNKDKNVLNYGFNQYRNYIYFLNIIKDSYIQYLLTGEKVYTKYSSKNNYDSPETKTKYFLFYPFYLQYISTPNNNIVKSYYNELNDNDKLINSYYYFPNFTVS